MGDLRLWLGGFSAGFAVGFVVGIFFVLLSEEMDKRGGIS